MTTGRKRGRPKGSGINDRDTLLRIAALIAANPGKKRTTAIKEIGITNPSVVRRLRDKFAESEASLIAEVTASKGARKARETEASGAGTAKVAGKKGKSNGRTAAPVASGIAADPLLAAGRPASGKPASASGAPSAASAPAAAADPLAAIFEGLNIETLVTQFIGHALGLDADSLKNSPIPALIREQARMIDLILPLLQTLQAPMAQPQAKAA